MEGLNEHYQYDSLEVFNRDISRKCPFPETYILIAGRKEPEVIWNIITVNWLKSNPELVVAVSITKSNEGFFDLALVPKEMDSLNSVLGKLDKAIKSKSFKFVSQVAIVSDQFSTKVFEKHSTLFEQLKERKISISLILIADQKVIDITDYIS